MKIFVSYRRSIDSTDRFLRQVIEYFQRSVDIRKQYRIPFLNGESIHSSSADAVLDLRLARASSSDATLIIALTIGRPIRDLDIPGSSKLTDQAGIVENILASGLHRFTSRKDYGRPSGGSNYRNLLTIGIGNAVRKTLAIKRLLLLRIPGLVPLPNWSRAEYLGSPSHNGLDELVLQELQGVAMPDRGAVMSSTVAGIALLAGDQRGGSGTLRIWDPAHVFRTPAGEDTGWGAPDGGHAQGVPLAELREGGAQTIQSSVDELTARIVLEKRDGLAESDFLALQEGIVDRGKSSRLSGIHRLLQRIRLRSTVKTSLKLTKDSKHRASKREKRGIIARSVAPSTVFGLFERSVLRGPSRFASEFSKHLERLMIHKSGLVIDSAVLRDIGALMPRDRGGGAHSGGDSGGPEPGFSEDGFASHLSDDWSQLANDAESEICGIYIVYRFELGGGDTNRVWRETLQIERDDQRFLVNMSVLDERSARPRAVRFSEGELEQKGAALLLVERTTQRNSPSRIVGMFLDEVGVEDSVLSCRIGAAADVRGPGMRRLSTACSLLVRVRWKPGDAREFMRQATRAGTFDEIVRPDFGNDESDLDYIKRLLRKTDVGEHLKGRIAEKLLPNSSRAEYCDLDLHPLERGLDNILGRAMADRAISAPFKPGWSESPVGRGARARGSPAAKEGKKS